jgi:hypothetical protein
LRDLCEKEQLKEKQSSSGDIFSEVIVNDAMCGICGEYFKMEDRNVEKRQDLEEVQEDTEIPVLSQPASTTSQPIASESSSNIFHKMFSDVKGISSTSLLNSLIYLFLNIVKSCCLSKCFIDLSCFCKAVKPSWIFTLVSAGMLMI